MSVQAVVTGESPVVVAVDVGKRTVALSVTDAARHRLLGPVDFEMSGRGLDGVLALIRTRLAGIDAPVRVGIEAAGHYHRPLLTPSVWPADWQVLELNPAHVAEQRGSRDAGASRPMPWIWKRSPSWSSAAVAFL